MDNKKLRQQWLTVPNLLTAIRLIAIPIMCRYILSGDNNMVAFILFLAIWATDLLDGFIARRFNQITDVGKVLDPLVDKVFQFATAVTLWLSGRLPLWVPIMLFLNQAFLVLGAALLWKKGTVVRSAWYGKTATVLLTACFAVLFLLNAEQYWLADYLFAVPVLLTFFSTFMYTRDYYSEHNPVSTKQERLTDHESENRQKEMDRGKDIQERECTKSL